MFQQLFGLGAMDAERFTRFVAKTGVDLGRFGDPEVDVGAMTIKDSGDMLDLHNMYATFLKLPRGERLRFIKEVVLAKPPDAPDTWDEVKLCLVPTVRDGAYLTFAGLQAAHVDAPEHLRLARRELAPNLFETVAVDMPDHILHVTEDRLADWGVTIDEALEIAHARLRRMSTDAFQQIIPGLWIAPWHDSYAASRVMLPDVLQRVCTDPLVTVPNRDVLAVADPTQPGAFEKLVALLEKVEEDDAPYVITKRIYKLEHKTLRAYEPPVDSPAYAAYRRMLVIEQAGCYEREQELHKQLGSDAFYAKMFAMQTPSGEIITRATWTKGVDESYLPPVEALHLIELDDATMRATRMWELPWSKAIESGLLTPVEGTLPRWRAGEFPSMTWLSEHATELDTSPRN